MFATVFAALLVGHYLGDYFVQTDYQAQHKGLTGDRSREGRHNCGLHALSYTVTLYAFLSLVFFADGVPFSWQTTSVVYWTLLLNGFTHYLIDRRWMLEAVARRMGKSGWIDADPEALPKLDQAAHVVLLGVFALIIAALI